MTEEQNKLADEIDVLIGRLRMHAGASDTHIPRPLLATAADALAALREREPATDAVRDQVLEEAAKVCDEMPCDCCWHEDAQIMAETCAAAIRALKGKGASQGVARIRPTHAAADAFWAYWKANGETHKHGYYESTWGAINAALAACPDEQKG